MVQKHTCWFGSTCPCTRRARSQAGEPTDQWGKDPRVGRPAQASCCLVYHPWNACVTCNQTQGRVYLCTCLPRPDSQPAICYFTRIQTTARDDSWHSSSSDKYL